MQPACSFFQFSPSRTRETFTNLVIMAGRSPTVLTKITSLTLEPGEIRKIDLANHRKVISELKLGGNATNLILSSDQGRLDELQSVKSEIFRDRKLKLCLKSWQLNPLINKPLYIELHNFSSSPITLGRTGFTVDVTAFGVSQLSVPRVTISPSHSQTISFEKYRKHLAEQFTTPSPTTVLNRTFFIGSYVHGAIASVDDFEKIIDFCASPKN